MKIGLTYDTKEDYGFKVFDEKHCDFVSAAEVSFIKNTLEESGHTVTLLGNCSQVINHILENKELPDIMFNMSWGYQGRNREGLMPALLEAFQIPYTGTDAFGCSLCLDKIQTKLCASYLGIPTPLFFEIRQKETISCDLPFPFPVVLKPKSEGSSMGVYLAKNYIEFRNYACQLLDEYKETVLCEEYIEGRELQVPLLADESGVKAVNILETTMADGSPIVLYSAHLKHSHAVKKKLADIPPATADQIISCSEKLFDYLGCRDFGRADFRLTPQNKLYFLEMAPLPSLKPGSSFHTGCKYFEIDSKKILENILNSARNRYTDL